MKALRHAAFLLMGGVSLLIGASTNAAAVCGDVTGDDRVSTSDALAVLQEATGLSPVLTCDASEPEALPPATIEYLNDFDCANGQNRRVLRLDGRVLLTANTGELSDPVDWSEPDVQLSGDLCGFPWLTNARLPVAPNRRLIVIELVRDENLYPNDGTPQSLFWIDLMDFGPRGSCDLAPCIVADYEPQLIARYPARLVD